MSRMVKCAKLGEELPGLPVQALQRCTRPAHLRQHLREGWQEWIEHSKRIVNEYRLDLTQKKAHEVLKEQCEAFLFGEAARRPPSTCPRRHEH